MRKILQWLGVKFRAFKNSLLAIERGMAYRDAAEDAVNQLAKVLPAERLIGANAFLSEGEPGLAIEVAARIAVEDQVPLNAKLAEQLIALLAQTEWAEHVPPEQLRALVTLSSNC